MTHPHVPGSMSSSLGGSLTSANDLSEEARGNNSGGEGRNETGAKALGCQMGFVMSCHPPHASGSPSMTNSLHCAVPLPSHEFTHRASISPSPFGGSAVRYDVWRGVGMGCSWMNGKKTSKSPRRAPVHPKMSHCTPFLTASTQSRSNSHECCRLTYLLQSFAWCEAENKGL